MIQSFIGRVRALFSRGGSSPEFVHVPIPESRLREMLAEGGKDLVLRTTSEGTVSATCKACREVVDLVEKDGLLWLQCPTCRRLSFNAIANVHRDVRFATEDGKPFEYEIFYLKQVPQQLRPPFQFLIRHRRLTRDE